MLQVCGGEGGHNCWERPQYDQRQAQRAFHVFSQRVLCPACTATPDDDVCSTLGCRARGMLSLRPSTKFWLTREGTRQRPHSSGMHIYRAGVLGGLMACILATAR